MAVSKGRKVLLACAIAGMVTAGCSTGPGAVSRAQVEKEISTKMTGPDGHKPESVKCPQDLKAEVGAQLNCTMTADGEDHTVNVTVTSIDGDHANFDMVNTIDKDKVASRLSGQLTEQIGSAPDWVTCPENLKGLVGATLRCQLGDGDDKYGITVTVTSVEGSNVGYNYAVDSEPEK